MLQLPQLINSKYQAGNAESYSQFMSTVLLNLYPSLVAKQPKEHDSFLHEVMHAIVDTAAAVIGYAVAGPAVFTAVADASYQKVAEDIGWQDGFSLKSAIAAGIEAGVTTDIMPPVGATPLAMRQAVMAAAAAAPSAELSYRGTLDSVA